MNIILEFQRTVLTKVRGRGHGTEQGLVNIHRLIDSAILQESCTQFAAFKMPLAFSAYVKMLMYE